MTELSRAAQQMTSCDQYLPVEQTLIFDIQETEFYQAVFIQMHGRRGTCTYRFPKSIL